jgi:hypothetical protein
MEVTFMPWKEQQVLNQRRQTRPEDVEHPDNISCTPTCWLGSWRRSWR